MGQIITVAAFLVLVYISACFFLCHDEKDRVGEALFLGFLIPSGLVILYATILAVLGGYSILLLGILLSLTVIPLGFFAFRNKKLITPRAMFLQILGHKFSRTALVVLVAAALLYALFPTYFLFGSRDPGLYAINAVRVARTGSYQVEEDKFITENYEVMKDILKLKFPGIYSDYELGLSKDPGDRTAQFLPMFSATLAVGYDYAGLEGLFRVNAILSILAMFMAYYFVKEFFDPVAAKVALLLFLTNPAQLWAARITQTEILAQLLVLIALYLFARTYPKGLPTMGLVAGAILGFGVMNRIDMLILGAGVYTLSAYTALFDPKKIRYGVTMAFGYTVGALVSTIYTYMYCRPYFDDLFGTNSLSGILKVNLAFLAFYVVCLAVRGIFLRGKTQNVFLSFITRRRVMIIFSALLALAFLYAYFIRPRLSDAPFETELYFIENSMAEFCFYTSFAAIPVAIFGLYQHFTQRKESIEPLFLFYLTGFVSLIGYIYRPSISADHLWASRRYVSVVFPFVLILLAYGISRLGEVLPSIVLSITRRRKGTIVSMENIVEVHPTRTKVIRGIAVALTATYFIGYGVYMSRLFLFSTMFDGIVADFGRVSDRLDDDERYYTDDEYYSAALRYVYGENIYLLQQKPSEISRQVISDGEMYILTDDVFAEKMDLDIACELIEADVIGGTYITPTINRYPDSTYAFDRTANLYKLSALTPENGLQREVDLGRFGLPNGSLSDGMILSSGTPGYVFVGPYSTIGAGLYEITVQMSLVSAVGDLVMTVDTSGEEATKVYGSTGVFLSDFAADGGAEIHFVADIPYTITDMEIRGFAPDGAVVRVESVVIQRIS